MIEDRLRESLTGKFLSMRGFIHIRTWKFERKDIIGKLAGQTKRMRKREREWPIIGSETDNRIASYLMSSFHY